MLGEHDWTFLDAFYYCFISLTTIGLGDYIPGDKVEQPNRGIYKILTTGYLIVGIICMMVFLAVLYDMPYLNLSRLFTPKDNFDGERSRLARKDSPSTNYTRQIDEEVTTPSTPPRQGTATNATEAPK
uniref:Potassium channel domain-containing protein n=1 Tax=Romanomermis culicivorax TaxID=13658 RepID=A0A915IA90_ROMCU